MTSPRFSLPAFIFSLLFTLFPGTGLFSEEYVLCDFGATGGDGWTHGTDGFKGPEEITVDYEINQKAESAFLVYEFTLPAVSYPSYFILKPRKGYAVPEIKSIREVSVEIVGYNYQIDCAVLLEDNSGRRYEFFMGSICFDGVRSMHRTFPAGGDGSFFPIDGAALAGIVFYPEPRSGAKVGNALFPLKRGIDLGKLVITGE